MNNSETIKSAKKRFDSQLHTDLYKKVHSDAEQLDKLINLMEISNNQSYLDLGTGNGYIAFELAKRFQNIHVYGLDIATNSIQINKSIKEKEHINNIYFDHYEGMNIPYTDKMFHGCISRYVLHHFPDISASLKELERITQKSGYFILSDPLTYDEDDRGFIDKFQSIINDGHIHFYNRKEIESIFNNHKFVVENEFYSQVRFSRKITTSYKSLFDQTDDDILNKYSIEFVDDNVFVTVKVMNILFRHTGNSI